MTSRFRLIVSVLLFASTGCASGPGQNTAQVPGNPFSSGAAGTPPVMPELSPDAKQESIRVTQVGQQILTSNPQLPFKPQVLMVGGPAEEIFHRGSQDIVITEGLARKCTTDAQLAAVLCHELARQVSEREALERFSPRFSNGPPPDVRVGNDYQGAFGPSDGTRMMELAKFDKEERERHAKALSPDVLAQIYLQRTGHPAEALTEVAPLLKAANKNATLEKQFTNHSPLSPG